MTRPTVFLGMPYSIGIYHSIVENLQHHGFDVIGLLPFPDTFRLSPAARLGANFRKLVLGDKQAKHKFKQAALHRHILRILKTAGQADYALFIRSDLYPPELLSETRTRVRRTMVNYQWDGMNRYPEIWQTVSAFDRFFVFDPADLQPGQGFLPLTNFYCSHDTAPVTGTETDFYFAGSHLSERSGTIAAFGTLARKHDWALDFNIVCGRKDLKNCRRLYPQSIKLHVQTYSYAENLQRAKRAKILVDFKAPVHNGLSFRAFEALGYRKKLITTNAEIKKYDFYRPENIFIWDGKTLDGIRAFLNTPYREIPHEIREKYSFGNWIRYVLDIPPYRSITLPAATLMPVPAK